MDGDSKKLYPAAFVPIINNFDWGRETVLLADLGYLDSEIERGWLIGNTIGEIMETYLDRVTGDAVYYHYGRQFPLAFRIMDISSEMPLMVCPDDIIAEQRYDALGKKKFWYVLEAGDDARIVLGLGKSLSVASFYEGCLTGAIGDSLNSFTPRRGDCFIMHPGTVHAASGHIRLLEIAEASHLDLPIAFCAAEDSNLEAALDFIDYRRFSPPAPSLPPPEGLSTPLAFENEFRVEKIVLSEALKVEQCDNPGFFVYYCIEGAASIEVLSLAGVPEGYTLRKGNILLVPSEVTSYAIVPRLPATVLLEATTIPEKIRDSYIDGDGENYSEGY